MAVGLAVDAIYGCLTDFRLTPADRLLMVDPEGITDEEAFEMGKHHYGGTSAIGRNRGEPVGGGAPAPVQQRVQRGQRAERGGGAVTPGVAAFAICLAVLFLAVGTVVGVAPVVLGWTGNMVLGLHRPDPQKNSPYECGFEAFEDARMKFDVRYYLVAILFIIFDLEVAFLFPWAVSLGDIGIFGFWSMVVFLGVLTIGFVYEWKKGALEWE